MNIQKVTCFFLDKKRKYRLEQHVYINKSVIVFFFLIISYSYHFIMQKRKKRIVLKL